MTRIEKVYQGLLHATDDEGITAGMLSEQLGLTRANCSAELNRLCQEGRAEKTGSRPVYYHAVDVQSTAPIRASADENLQTFEVHNPSLSNAIALAQAAVLYPPRGMDMLLLGETGVGKSMFAAQIHRFAALHWSRKDVPFISFNCADYAANPQLLLSQLFGVQKGAYTGADQDKAGLMEQADGGILFLDEIHRLPPEGQEMLFTYMDRGCFRRLGESSAERPATVLLVCATTEQPDSALLQSFLRRLPVTISIPSLADRSFAEREQLIFTFFSEQALQLGQPLRLSLNSLRALMGYSCSGNVGQLRSDIKLLCAKAYAQFIRGETDQISIYSYLLSPHMRSGFFNEKVRKKIWQHYGDTQKRFVAFPCDGSSPTLPHQAGLDIYAWMDRQTQDMKRVGMEEQDVRVSIDQLLHDYYQSITEEGAEQGAPLLEGMIGSEFITTAEKMLQLAQDTLNRSISPQIRSGLIIHIYNTVKRIQDKKSIVNPRIDVIADTYPAEWELGKQCLEIFYEDFGIRPPADEAAFLTLFFTPDAEQMRKTKSVEIIVVAHGIGTASGMVDAANHLIGAKHATAFDMPMTQSPHLVYDAIREHLSASEAKQALLMVDMGSLADFAQELERDLSIRCMVFSLTSTLHVVEAARVASLGKSLDAVYQALQEVGNGSLNVRAEPSVPSSAARLFIICTCSTGEGSAVMLRQMLESQLDLEGCACEIRTWSVLDREEFSARTKQLSEQGRVVAVVSAFDSGLALPHYSIDQVLNGSAIAPLQRLLNWQSLRFRAVESVGEMLDQLDGNVAIEVVHDLVSELIESLRINVSEEVLVGIFCHILFMLNRLKTGWEAPPFQHKEQFSREHSSVLLHVKQKSRRIEIQFDVCIPEDELYYIASFFTQNNSAQNRP